MLLNISTWWKSMQLFEQMFWAIALLFSILFLLQTILSFAGGDNDTAVGDADSYVDQDDGIGYQFFTIKNMIAFFTMFGWTGIACIKGGKSVGVTLMLALLAGVIVVALMAVLMRSMNRLKESGTMQIENAINKTATVYLVIPAARKGFGKVHVQVQGTLRELRAVTDETADIPSGSLVKVKGVINENILLITSDIV